MRLQVNRPVLHRGTCWVLAQIVVTLPVMRRPNRPRRKTTTAVRADVAQNHLHTVNAKRAFETANPRVQRVRRQEFVAVFAGGAELEHGKFIS